MGSLIITDENIYCLLNKVNILYNKLWEDHNKHIYCYWFVNAINGINESWEENLKIIPLTRNFPFLSKNIGLWLHSLELSNEVCLSLWINHYCHYSHYHYHDCDTITFFHFKYLRIFFKSLIFFIQKNYMVVNYKTDFDEVTGLKIATPKSGISSWYWIIIHWFVLGTKNYH